MNTKLTVTLALATSLLGGAAHAYDTLDGSDMSFGDKLAIDSSINSLWGTEDGKLAASTALGADEPVLDTLDPGEPCKAIPAEKSFYQPLYTESLAGQSFSVGVEGEAKLLADAGQLGVQVAFGPAAQILGSVRRPMDVRLTAATKPGGLNSLDLSFFAFGYEIDSYNIASTSNPIQHIASHTWTLPNVLTGSLWNGSIGCSIRGVLQNCQLGWDIRSEVVANLSAILVLKVNPNGVEGHVIASANSHLALTTSGTLAGEVLDPIAGDYVDFSATASGTGVVNVGRAYFSTHGTLKPKDGQWVASLDAGYNIEDVLLARASIGTRIVGRDRRWTLFNRGGRNFSDSYFYQCTFDKQFN